MAIPSVHQLTLPVLQALGDGNSWSTDDLCSELARDFELTEEELAQTRADGRRLFYNRIQWARTRLKQSGSIVYPKQCYSKITQTGLTELKHRGIQLRMPQDSADGHLAARFTPSVLHLRHATGSLEDELRELCGPAVNEDAAWEIICRLNGWGPFPPQTYRCVAEAVDRTERDLLRLARQCKQSYRREAPLLDAVLAVALACSEQDPRQLSLTIAKYGLADTAFSVAGLAEAARRFHRTREWRRLVEYLAAQRMPRTLPRPFESWFEVDVFLYVSGLGYSVQPQYYVHRYRVDMMVQGLARGVVIECNGDRWHSKDREDADRDRRQFLESQGLRVEPILLSHWRKEETTVRQRLAELLAEEHRRRTA